MKHLTEPVEVSRGHSVARFHLETVQSDFQDELQEGEALAMARTLTGTGLGLRSLQCLLLHERPWGKFVYPWTSSSR